MEMSEREWHFLQVFRDFTGVSPLFCVETDHGLVFVVPAPEIALAIGKNGARTKALSRRLRKAVFVIPEVDGAEGVIRAFFKEPVAINQRGRLYEVSVLPEHRAWAIGRNGTRVKTANAFLKKLYGVGVRIR